LGSKNEPNLQAKMKCFFYCDVVFGKKLIPSVFPPFSKSEKGGEKRDFSLLNFVYWNLGEAGA